MPRATDLLVIGGGPAGLSAALNGAAEGMAVTLLEASGRLGGQAGTSARIENYLGFPDGCTGAELTRLSALQAARLGAELVTRAPVRGLYPDGRWTATYGAGLRLEARAVILAVGLEHKRLKLPACPCPLHYGATPDDHARYAGRLVAVIGGGNSAGQAAVSLAAHGAHVDLIVRRPIALTMSAYLIERIAADPAITEVRASASRLRYGGYAAGFIYAGSHPATQWLKGACQCDHDGYVLTRSAGDLEAAPGLYVAGDVRSGSRKRIAVAAGEGALAAAQAYLD